MSKSRVKRCKSKRDVAFRRVAKRRTRALLPFSNQIIFTGSKGYF